MNVYIRSRSVPATPPSCLCVPTCPLDQGKPRCERTAAGAIAGYCFLLLALFGVVACAVAVVVTVLS